MYDKSYDDILIAIKYADRMLSGANFLKPDQDPSFVRDQDRDGRN